MDVWDTDTDGEADKDASSEFEGQEDTEISELREFEKLAVCDSMELWDGSKEGVVVNDPWPDGVDVIVEHTVVLGDADKDGW